MTSLTSPNPPEGNAGVLSATYTDSRPPYWPGVLPPPAMMMMTTPPHQLPPPSAIRAWGGLQTPVAPPSQLPDAATAAKTPTINSHNRGTQPRREPFSPAKSLTSVSRTSSSGNRSSTTLRSASHQPVSKLSSITSFSKQQPSHVRQQSQLNERPSARSIMTAPDKVDDAVSSDNIKVAVRVRPMNALEQRRGDATAVTIDPTDFKRLQLSHSRDPRGTISTTKSFDFHACLGPEADQADVMRLCGIPQLLDAAMDGYNVTLMAYGQTGSGKTYTISGRDDVDSPRFDEGIVPRSAAYIFDQIIQNNKRADGYNYAVSASYCEIYNEGVYDLLLNRGETKQLHVRWDAHAGAFFVPNLTTVLCTDVSDLLQVASLGVKKRRVGCHALNNESSRSHAILSVMITSTPQASVPGESAVTRKGKVSFVDLAGSERLKDSKSSGNTMKETSSINRSLFMLGNVISALADGQSGPRVPYRESKLTKLLMDSLGGGALCLMIACCSPSQAVIEETLSTLGYATRAKNIKTRPAVQVDAHEAALNALQREARLLRIENEYLRQQLQLAYQQPRSRRSGEEEGPEITHSSEPQARSGESEEAYQNGLSLSPQQQAADSQALYQRLEEAQTMVSTFMRENKRLVVENSQLRAGKYLVSSDYGEALEEVEWLRAKLEALEGTLKAATIESARTARREDDSQGRQQQKVEGRRPATPRPSKMLLSHEGEEEVDEEEQVHEELVNDLSL